jgi:hypothetical protein
VLSVGTIMFLGSLPLSWFSYNRHLRRMALAHPATASRPASTVQVAPQPSPPAMPPDDERPARLN